MWVFTVTALEGLNKQQLQAEQARVSGLIELYKGQVEHYKKQLTDFNQKYEELVETHNETEKLHNSIKLELSELEKRMKGIIGFDYNFYLGPLTYPKSLYNTNSLKNTLLFEEAKVRWEQEIEETRQHGETAYQNANAAEGRLKEVKKALDNLDKGNPFLKR